MFLFSVTFLGASDPINIIKFGNYPEKGYGMSLRQGFTDVRLQSLGATVKASLNVATGQQWTSGSMPNTNRSHTPPTPKYGPNKAG